VALSDDEQRLLAEIEQGLVADDVRFPDSIGRRGPGVPSVAWAVGICVGLSCVVVGLVIADSVGIALALIGFALIVAGCWAALWSHRQRRRRPPRDMAA